VFLITGLTALIVATITVIYHAVKAAISDPVLLLRYE
jgi:ABC-type lipoprotein release transport system permease subunit